MKMNECINSHWNMASSPLFFVSLTFLVLWTSSVFSGKKVSDQDTGKFLQKAGLLKLRWP